MVFSGETHSKPVRPTTVSAKIAKCNHLTTANNTSKNRTASITQSKNSNENGEAVTRENVVTVHGCKLPIYHYQWCARSIMCKVSRQTHYVDDVLYARRPSKDDLWPRTAVVTLSAGHERRLSLRPTEVDR